MTPEFEPDTAVVVRGAADRRVPEPDILHALELERSAISGQLVRVESTLLMMVSQKRQPRRCCAQDGVPAGL